MAIDDQRLTALENYRQLADEHDSFGLPSVVRIETCVGVKEEVAMID